MYLSDDEQREVWKNVRASYDQDISNSAVLYKLVQERNWQIKDGSTKRGIALETLEIVKAMNDKLNKLMSSLSGYRTE